MNSLPFSTSFSDPKQTRRLLMISLDPVAADYAAHLQNHPDMGEVILADWTKTGGRLSDDVVRASTRSMPAGFLLRVLVFADGQSGRAFRRACGETRRLNRLHPVAALALVHPCGALAGDKQARQREEAVEQLAAAIRCPSAVFRCGVVWSEHSAARGTARRLGFLHPFLNDQIGTSFLDPDRLFAVLDEWQKAPASRFRMTRTVLGPRRPWREVWAESGRPAARWARLAGAFAAPVLRPMISALIAQWWRWLPARRHWNLSCLAPRDTRELIDCFRGDNSPHVQPAGCNNGVRHFGWRFPDRLVCLTSGCGRRVRMAGGSVIVDAGVTLKRCVDELGRHGHALLVTPNYSYVAMGTAFFVPIHGSGSEVSTLGETIEAALLYDPRRDRIFRVRRGETGFDRYYYNRGAGVLLLRLRLRAKPRARYALARETLQSPSADALWEVFTCRQASNVEVRKHRAADASVEVYRYYAQAPAVRTETLELPRDHMGRVWDRIEENALAARLFHWLVRTRACHVELFMNADEFRVFWARHRNLPLNKLQLRPLRQDPSPHSPTWDGERVSVDLFMWRRRREEFLRFVTRHLPHVRFNPGKQSL